jgi:hypothetical protein
MQQQIITPQRRPVRRYDQRALDLELARIEQERQCAYRVQGRTSFGSFPNVDTNLIPFTPAVYASLVGWWDMQDAAAYVDAGGGVCSSITNKVSSVVTSQATAGSRPSIVAGFNGFTCLDFDGTADHFIITEAAVVTALTDSNPHTLIIAGAFDAPTTLQCMFGAGNSTQPTNSSRFYGTSATTGGHWYSGCRNAAGSTKDILSTGASNANKNIFAFDASGATSSIRVNNAAADPSATAQAPGTTTIDRVAVASYPRQTNGSFLNGQIAEICLFNTQLTAPQILTVVQYMGTKWGVTIAP